MSLLFAQKQGKKNSGIETRSGSEPGQRLVEQGFSLKWQFKIIKRTELLQRKILFSIVMGCGTWWLYGSCCVRWIHHCCRAFGVCWFILSVVWKEWKQGPQSSSAGGISASCMCSFCFHAIGEDGEKLVTTFPLNWWVDPSLKRERYGIQLHPGQKGLRWQLPLSWKNAGFTRQKFTFFCTLVPLGLSCAVLMCEVWSGYSCAHLQVWGRKQGFLSILRITNGTVLSAF